MVIKISQCFLQVNTRKHSSRMPTSMAFSLGGCLPGVGVFQGGVCLEGCLPGAGGLHRGCLPRRCLPSGGEGRGSTTPHLWTEGMTHACKNMTFPQLLFLTVKIIINLAMFIRVKTLSLSCPSYRYSPSMSLVLLQPNVLSYLYLRFE